MPLVESSLGPGQSERPAPAQTGRAGAEASSAYAGKRGIYGAASSRRWGSGLPPESLEPGSFTSTFVGLPRLRQQVAAASTLLVSAALPKISYSPSLSVQSFRFFGFPYSTEATTIVLTSWGLGLVWAWADDLRDCSSVTWTLGIYWLSWACILSTFSLLP